MGKRIHTRIFLSILIIMTLLLASVWGIFLISSGQYAEYIAEKNITNTTNQIVEFIDETFGETYEAGAQSKKKEREFSKELMTEIRTFVKDGKLENGLLVLSTKLEQVYEAGSYSDAVLQDIYNTAIELIQAEEEGGIAAAKTEAEFLSIDSDGVSWKFKMLKIDSSAKIRAKYFVIFARVPEIAMLLEHASSLLLIITGLCVMIAGVAAWLVARSISRPLRQLCSRVDQIGNGSLCILDENYSLCELEQLKDAFNRMELRLEEVEEQNHRFFQNVSHDLRTPLASIMGYAQGIQCGVMKNTKAAAGIIVSESLRMSGLVESILTISKLESHELKLNRVKLDLMDFLEEQVERVQGIADEKAVCLEIREWEAAQRPVILADPELLARIIQNVLSNCIRYAEKQVVLSVKQEEERVCMMIEDDGSGFSEDMLSGAFERFQKGEGGGHGIGLSIVKNGMEYIGGKVFLRNREKPLHGAVYELVFFPEVCGNGKKEEV